jgi:predicted transcriptional regulator
MVNVRVNSELKAELQRLAEADDRKLSAYIERVLREHVVEKSSRSGRGKKASRT